MARVPPAPQALPMLPSRALLALLRGMWRQWRCPHAFTGEDGYARCSLCGSWEMP